jgi:hypothetical protein
MGISNIYHRFGTGGRLGLGHEKTVFQPTLVTGINDCISYVATGYDHTLAVTNRGGLWSWGSNANHVLGYEFVKAKVQKSPREILIKNAYIVGAAASRFHSVAYTKAGALYTWGTNNGQLGYECQIQLIPRKIATFSHQEIISVATTDFSTIILTKTRSVLIFADGVQTKVKFPIRKEKAGKITVANRASNSPAKICTGHTHVACTMENGDIYLWSPSKQQIDVRSYVEIPTKVWTTQKHFEVAVDCAIGVDSSLVVLTSAGHVFVGERYKMFLCRNGICTIYKFKMVPNLEHITNVTASNSGSFAALRSDFRTSTECNATQDIQINRAKSSNFDFVFVTRDGCRTEAHRVVLLKNRWFSAYFMKRIDFLPDGVTEIKIDGKKGLSLDFASEQSLKLLLDYFYTGSIEKPWLNPLDNFRSSLEVSAIEKEFDKLTEIFKVKEIIYQRINRPTNFIWNFENTDMFTDLCVEVKDGQVICHSVFLMENSKFFRGLLEIHDRWSFEFNENQQRIVNLRHIPKVVLKIIVKWVETANSDAIFENITKNSLDEWILLILELLIVADELDIEGLVSVCSCILARFLNVKNSLDMLNIALIHNAHELKDASLDFGSIIFKS